MTRLVRKPWAARFAVFAILAGLLVQVALAMPARLAMAQAAPVCSVAHGGVGDTPDRTAHGHVHCLLCQSHAGPPLLVAAATLASPAGHACRAETSLAPRGFVAVPVSGFQSRAPPALA